MKKITKRVYIELEDGRTFSVSAHEVADDRAKFYVDRDGTWSYEEEYKYVGESHDTLEDWLFANMNWQEMSPKLEKTEHCSLWDAEVRDKYIK